MSILKDRARGEGKGGSIEEARYLVIDTELTGLNGRKDSIVSIGAVRMKGGRIDLSDTFYRMINPETSLTAESVIIHEIMPSDVLLKPDIGAVLREFLDYCGSDILIGFCVSIDMEFLNREAKRLFGAPMGNRIIDIYPLFEWMLRKGDFREKGGAALPHHYKLYDMAKYFEIEVNGAHNAMIDAFITAQIFQRLIPALSRAEIRDAEDLVRLTKNFKGGDRNTISCNISNF